MHERLFTAASLIIAQTWEQATCSMEWRISKLCFSHTAEQWAKTNHPAMWVNCTGINGGWEARNLHPCCFVPIIWGKTESKESYATSILRNESHTCNPSSPCLKNINWRTEIKINFEIVCVTTGSYRQASWVSRWSGLWIWMYVHIWTHTHSLTCGSICRLIHLN